MPLWQRPSDHVSLFFPWHWHCYTLLVCFGLLFFRMDVKDQAKNIKYRTWERINRQIFQAADYRVMQLYSETAATGSDILVYHSKVCLTSCSAQGKWKQHACVASSNLLNYFLLQKVEIKCFTFGSSSPSRDTEYIFLSESEMEGWKVSRFCSQRGLMPTPLFIISCLKYHLGYRFMLLNGSCLFPSLLIFPQRGFSLLSCVTE